jgi:hypothetical protein
MLPKSMKIKKNDENKAFAPQLDKQTNNIVA